MSNFPKLRDRVVDPSTGVPLNGAKLYTYEPGTTTNKATYTTAVRTIAHTNPIVSDANGLFPEIYLTPDTTYRFILKTSADVTLFDVDDIAPTALDGDLNAQFYELAESPLHQGAVGNGSDDDSTQVQDAINAATLGTRNGVVDLYGRTYRCDTGLILPSGIKLRNGTLDFSNCHDDAFLHAQGDTGVPVAVTADIAAGDDSFDAASISGVSSNNLLHLYQDAGSTAGEIVRVASASGSTITIAGQTHGAYATANTARYIGIVPVTGIVLEDLEIIGNAGASGLGDAIVLDLCKGVRLRNVSVRTTKGVGLAVKRSCDTVVESCSFVEASSGVEVRDASIDTVIEGCSFVRMSSASGAVRIGQNANAGVTYKTRVVSSSVQGSERGISIETHSGVTHVVGCQIGGGSTEGVYVVGRDVAIRDCAIYGFQYPVRIAATAALLAGVNNVAPVNLTVRGNALTCQGASGYCVLLTLSDADYEQIDISGNVLRGEGVHLSVDATIGGGQLLRRLTMHGNNQDCGTYSNGNLLLVTKQNGGSPVAIDKISLCGNIKSGGLEFVDSSAAASSLSLASAVIADNAGDGVIDLSGFTQAERVTITGNSLEVTSGTAGIYVSGNNVTVRGNTVSGAVSRGVSVSGSRCVVADNTLSGMEGGAFSAGVRAVDCDSVIISGNAIGSNDDFITYGVRVESDERACVSVSNNTINGIDNTSGSAGIRLSGGRYTNLNIAGNAINSRYHCILFAGAVDNLCLSGNSCDTSVGGGVAAISITGTNAGDVNHVAISGNSVDASRALLLSGYIDGGAIAGNVFQGATATYNTIDLTGSVGSAVHNIAITGNAIREGVYGISASNTARVIHDGNSFYSPGTSHQNGLAAGTSGAGGNYVS
jgi:hypothetical protein